MNQPLFADLRMDTVGRLPSMTPMAVTVASSSCVGTRTPLGPVDPNARLVAQRAKATERKQRQRAELIDEIRDVMGTKIWDAWRSGVEERDRARAIEESLAHAQGMMLVDQCLCGPCLCAPCDAVHASRCSQCYPPVFEPRARAWRRAVRADLTYVLKYVSK